MNVTQKKWLAAGLCVYCGLHPIQRSQRCSDCYKKAMEWQNELYKRRKAIIYEHYGAVCKCCGETEPAFLTIDHINNDGAAHRKVCGSSLASFKWIIENNFPDCVGTVNGASVYTAYALIKNLTYDASSLIAQ